MNCPNCDTYNRASANYCSNCGRQLATPDNVEPEASGGGGTQSPHRIAQEIALSESTEYAGVGIRAIAYVIDFLLVNIMGIVILIAVDPSGLIAYVAAISYWVLFIGLRGQAPGKMVMGLHAVRAGRPVPGIGPALARETLGKLMSILSLGLGYAWASRDPRKQTWHDKLAGTYVIRTRTGIFTPPPE